MEGMELAKAATIKANGDERVISWAQEYVYRVVIAAREPKQHMNQQMARRLQKRLTDFVQSGTLPPEKTKGVYYRN